MKLLIVFAVAVACVAANDGSAPIVKFDSEVLPDGYRYRYETGNGIYGQEEGTLTQVNGQEYPSISVKGGFKYTSPEGPVEETYTADENGFQPQGAHIPVAPAIPELIQRALEYVRSHPKSLKQ